MTPSQARNAIRRSLKALIDPKPTPQQKAHIWAHFQHQCAYCGCPLKPSERKAHIDHLIAESEGGSNQLCNLILTCPTCNGDEKREHAWQAFLLEKCGIDQKKYADRRDRISQWQSEQGGAATLTPLQQALVGEAFDRVNDSFTSAVKQLRQSRS
tara:strand:- start:781 stop:1245 length:465 start_codon:yes stop_codon:yes gene_type:complete